MIICRLKKGQVTGSLTDSGFALEDRKRIAPDDKFYAKIEFVLSNANRLHPFLFVNYFDLKILNL